ncbi:hypothetical protein TGMAS_415820 [Toxoplasma gondii MAS]|uniref:Uncharacterized protein n=1 Tax=Toxoplasma gondii MAS TaxID=943118 RepID=A0A086Q4G0_TOXGO|nr:hypothetical protein TGMAS_415820 [Toxoplasma gondii MAS]
MADESRLAPVAFPILAFASSSLGPGRLHCQMFSFSLFFRIQGASPSSPSSTHCMHWLRRQICASRNPSGAGKSLQGTGRRRRSFARQPRAPHCERRASRGEAREAKRVGEAKEKKGGWRSSAEFERKKSKRTRNDLLQRGMRRDGTSL